MEKPKPKLGIYKNMCLPALQEEKRYELRLRNYNGYLHRSKLTMRRKLVRSTSTAKRTKVGQ